MEDEIDDGEDGNNNDDCSNGNTDRADSGDENNADSGQRRICTKDLPDNCKQITFTLSH